jgi:hypothetical protein
MIIKNVLRADSTIVALVLCVLASCATPESTDDAVTRPPSVNDTQATTTAAVQPPLTSERSLLVTISAEVKSINYETREVTLVGPEGNELDFVVDTRVQRLGDVMAGDYVTTDYYISLAGELRKPTAEELEEPLVILAGGGRTPEGTSPAGGALRAFRVVATVVGIDLPSQSVALQGPGGNVVDVVAEYPENLRKLKLGDTIIVTYTEALAVSLQKTAR